MVMEEIPEGSDKSGGDGGYDRGGMTRTQTAKSRISTVILWKVRKTITIILNGYWSRRNMLGYRLKIDTHL